MNRFVIALAMVAACGGSSGPGTDPDDPGTGSGAPSDPGNPSDPGIPADPGTPVASGGDPFGALRALPAACSDDHWCWRTPHPAGNTYSKVYATAPDNVWLIGDHGTVMQWNGTAWKIQHPPVQAGQPPAQYVAGIAGLGPNDMWLIYDATIQHWDGTAWTIRDSLVPNGITNFNSIWEAPNGDVWVTMNTGEVDRSLGGGAFKRIDTGCNCFIGSIWGLAANDFWMTTLPGNILHSDGHTFTTSYTGTTPIGGFVGKTANDVWTAGEDGVMLHWNGTAWAQVASGLADGFITPVAALATNDVWWWTSTSSAHSAFVHWDGAALTTTPLDTTAVGTFLYGGAIVDGKWWLVGGAGAIYTKDGAASIKSIVDPNVTDIQAMWGSADDDMYFATGGEILHWDGTTTTTIHIAASSISGRHTAAGNELFATGFELNADHTQYIADAYHFDGATWTKTQLDQAPINSHRYFTQVFAMAAGEAMAVGYGGIAYHYTAGAWQPVATGTTNDLLGVYGSDADHLWITGVHGTFLKWSRAAAATATVDAAISTTDDLGAIHGAGGVTWIVSGPTSVLQSTPTGWKRIEAGISIGGMFCADANNVVLASAGQSQIARWNGTAFVHEDSGAGLPSPVLFQPPGGKLLAGGLNVLVEHP